MAVEYSREGAVGYITLDKPPANSYDLAFMEELGGCVRSAAGDDGAGAVVLRSGSERFFSAGADIKAFDRNSVEENMDMIRRAHEALPIGILADREHEFAGERLDFRLVDRHRCPRCQVFVRTTTARICFMSTTASKNSRPVSSPRWMTFGVTALTTPVTSSFGPSFTVTRLPFCATSSFSSVSSALTTNGCAMETLADSANATASAHIGMTIVLRRGSLDPAARWAARPLGL